MKRIPVLTIGFLLLWGGPVSRVVAEAPATVQSDTNYTYPDCALNCGMGIVVKKCGALTNIDCVCNDNQVRAAMTACVKASCAPAEAIQVSEQDATLCSIRHEPRTQESLATLSLTIPAWLSVWVRLWVRWTMRRFESDDWLMMAVGVFYTVFTVCGQICAMTAFGQDVWTVPPDKLTLALKLFYVSESLYIAILGLTKLSVLLFYLRIFPNRGFRLAAWIVGSVIAAQSTTFLFLEIFQSWPIDHVWNGWKSDHGPHHSINLAAATLAHAICSIVQDMAILVLPLALLWRLKMTWRKKAGVIFMFSLGIFIVVTSCARLRYVANITASANPTWEYTDVVIWSSLETGVSVLVTSLPAISVLLKRTWPRIFNSTSISRNAAAPRSSAAPVRLNLVDLPSTHGSTHSSISNHGEDRKATEGMDSLATKTRGNKRQSGTRSRLCSVLGNAGGTYSPASAINESQLEPDDHMKGEVQTLICADGGREDDLGDKGWARLSAMPPSPTVVSPPSVAEVGIHVRTDTVRSIDVRTARDFRRWNFLGPEPT